MSDRYYALTVVLADDVRDDDAEPLINAIKQLRGVATVTPHVSDPSFHSAVMRAKTDITQRLWDALHSAPSDRRVVE
jgi:hypothetical protein